MILFRSLIISLAFISLWSTQARAWQPWDWDEANLTIECAAVYGSASYAVRSYNYKPAKGQTKQEVIDHFQRLSNILSYFSSNSGYEEKMKAKLEEAMKAKKAIIDKSKSVDALAEDIEKCDAHIDRLNTRYSE